ncbi:MAG: DNA recombination protein RmuC [Bacteroidales bacterium]|nr:DNA recombination protein RmuC [Bacteroidales bacterium]
MIVALIAGSLIGFLLASLLNRCSKKDEKLISELRKNIESLTIENRVQNKTLENKELEKDDLTKALDEGRQKIIALNIQLSASQSDLKNLSEKLKDQKRELEEIREKFVFEFKSLAGEIIQKESKIFTEQNKFNIESLLKPLGEKIKEFEKKVEDAYDKEAQQRFSLKEEVKRLSELNRQISSDAQNLTDALKGQSKTQGNWGELILESILEKSGLQKDREFVVQKSFITDNGRRLQPDVVLTLPANKNVVIDSKVSLTAYENFVSAVEEDQKNAALKSHLISLKKHIDELAAKDYQHLYALNSLDFVIMFMPVEPAFLEAVKHNHELWTYAYEKGVLLVSPTNLFATLKMVASLWQQEYQNRNVMDIADQSGKLYDKFVGFVVDLQAIGDKLTAAQGSYDNALSKLSAGKGNLISRAEKIKQLGAKTKKEIPRNLLESDENDD